MIVAELVIVVAFAQSVKMMTIARLQHTPQAHFVIMRRGGFIATSVLCIPLGVVWKFFLLTANVGLLLVVAVAVGIVKATQIANLLLL